MVKREQRKEGEEQKSSLHDGKYFVKIREVYYRIRKGRKKDNGNFRKGAF